MRASPVWFYRQEEVVELAQASVASALNLGTREIGQALRVTRYSAKKIHATASVLSAQALPVLQAQQPKTQRGLVRTPRSQGFKLDSLALRILRHGHVWRFFTSAS